MEREMHMMNITGKIKTHDRHMDILVVNVAEEDRIHETTMTIMDTMIPIATVIDNPRIQDIVGRVEDSDDNLTKRLTWKAIR